MSIHIHTYTLEHYMHLHILKIILKVNDYFRYTASDTWATIL